MVMSYVVVKDVTPAVLVLKMRSCVAMVLLWCLAEAVAGVMNVVMIVVVCNRQYQYEAKVELES